MKKSMVFNAVATAYVCAAIFMIVLVDTHPYMGAFLIVVCLFAAEEFHNLGKKARNKELLDHLNENGTGND